MFHFAQVFCCRYPIPPKAETKGFTDKYIGSWLQKQKRENVVLASKVHILHVRMLPFPASIISLDNSMRTQQHN